MTSVFEINEAIIPRLRRAAAGAPAEPDPLQEALAERKAALAFTVRQGTVDHVGASTEADKEEQVLRETKARADRLEQEMRLHTTQLQLNQIKEAQGAGGNSVLAEIIALLQQDKQQIMLQNEQARKEVLELLQGQISDLRNEVMTRAAQPATNGHRPSLTEEIQQAKDLLTTLREFAPPAPGADLASTGRSVEELVRMHEVQEAHEERMMRLKMQEKSLNADLEDRKERRTEDARRGEALTDAVGRALPFAQRFVQDVGGRLFSGGGEAAGQVAETPTPPFGPDTRVAPCSQCKTLIPFPPGATLVNCPNPACKVPHGLEEEKPAAPAAEPQPEAAVEEARVPEMASRAS